MMQHWTSKDLAPYQWSLDVLQVKPSLEQPWRQRNHQVITRFPPYIGQLLHLVAMWSVNAAPRCLIHLLPVKPRPSPRGTVAHRHGEASQQHLNLRRQREVSPLVVRRETIEVIYDLSYHLTSLFIFFFTWFKLKTTQKDGLYYFKDICLTVVYFGNVFVEKHLSQL